MLNAGRCLSSSANALAAWTKQEEDLLLQLRELGVPYREIANRLGRSSGALALQVVALRQRGQVPKQHRANVTTGKPWSEEETSALTSLRAEGKSSKEIALVLGRSIASVRRALSISSQALKDLSRTGSPWTAEDDTTLMAMRTNGSSWIMFGSALRRTAQGVCSRWHLLKGGHRRADSAWFFTREEDELLLRLKVDEKKTWHQIVLAFNGSKDLPSLKNRFSNLQTTTLTDRVPQARKPWTETDITKLRQLYDSSATRSSMALQLGRSKAAVINALRSHILKEIRRAPVPWSPEDDSTLLHRKQELHQPYREIAAALGRTARACEFRYNAVLKYRFLMSPGTEMNALEALDDKTTPVEQPGS